VSVYGQKGSTAFRSYDVLSPIEGLEEILTPEFLKGLRYKSANMNRNITRGVSRLKDLGMSRFRGATGMPAKVAIARSFRNRLDSVLRQAESVSANKKRMRETAESIDYLRSRSATEGTAAQYGMSVKGSQLNWAESMARITSSKYASRKRAMAKGLTGLAMVGSAFIPGLPSAVPGGLVAGGAATGAQAAMTQSAGGYPATMGQTYTPWGAPVAKQPYADATGLQFNPRDVSIAYAPPVEPEGYIPDELQHLRYRR
jgi:hypothetical protein